MHSLAVQAFFQVLSHHLEKLRSLGRAMKRFSESAGAMDGTAGATGRFALKCRHSGRICEETYRVLRENCGVLHPRIHNVFSTSRLSHRRTSHGIPASRGSQVSLAPEI